MKVFGYGSTDGHQQPYFALEIVSGPGAAGYKPAKSEYMRLTCELLTNNIYEVHD